MLDSMLVGASTFYPTVAHRLVTGDPVPNLVFEMGCPPPGRCNAIATSSTAAVKTSFASTRWEDSDSRTHITTARPGRLWPEQAICGPEPVRTVMMVMSIFRTGVETRYLPAEVLRPAMRYSPSSGRSTSAIRRIVQSLTRTLGSTATSGAGLSLRIAHSLVFRA